MTVVSPLEHRLRDLRVGETYRVCLYNEYYLGMDYEQNFCKEFELISNEADSNIAEVYEEVVIPAQKRRFRNNYWIAHRCTHCNSITDHRCCPILEIK